MDQVNCSKKSYKGFFHEGKMKKNHQITISKLPHANYWGEWRTLLEKCLFVANPDPVGKMKESCDIFLNGIAI